MEIEASSDEVWRVLTRFEDYPSWNSFIQKITGDFRVGEKLWISVHSGNGKEMTFKPRLLKIETPHEFCWTARLLVPGLDGEHSFRIQSTVEHRTVLVQEERFSGILVPLVWKTWEKNTREGFDKMNRALKKNVETERV